MTDEQTTGEAWREVGRQFQALGESLATAFRTAWESEENREHVQDMKTGLEAMVSEIGRAVQEASASPEAQRAREEVGRAAESARAAGAQALQEARPHLLSALRKVNAELQKMVHRLEQEEPAAEDPVRGSASSEPDVGQAMD
jgi:hypothetical protein